MASDWIKMRTDLYRDPKVCVIADLLMDGDSDLARFINQHCQTDMAVTRNVMRNTVVGALVSVWGVMRIRGKRIESDLFLKCASVPVVDDVADLPGLGDAMAHVGWIVETPEGLVFPRFFEEYNVDPSDDPKVKNAERQRRFRERHKADNSNETHNVTVTLKSNAREEKRISKPLKEKPLIPDWVPADAWAAWEAMRVAIKKPLTPRATNRALTKLAAFKAKGYDLTEILDRAENGRWTDLYEPKDAKPATTGNSTNDFLRRVLA